MKKKTLWITETAVMLALLIALQWVTKPLGQLVTGSCVNTVLAVAALFSGWSGGVVVATLSPLFAYFLGIAPNLLTVPVIMVGNTAFVLLLRLLCNGGWVKAVFGLFLAAVGKFLLVYGLVGQIICGVAADFLLYKGLLKSPMLNILPATFGWPQLITALIGGGIALLTVPALKKASHRT